MKNNITLDDEVINAKTLMFIQDFETNLKCAGICQRPTFWFYQDFFNGPPTSNCLTSFKNEFDKADGLLGYAFVAMGGAILLQLFSVCGLCCNRDRCNKKKKKDSEPEFADLPEQSQQDNSNS